MSAITSPAHTAIAYAHGAPDEDATMPPAADPQDTPIVTEDCIDVIATETPCGGARRSDNEKAVTIVGPTKSPAMSSMRAVRIMPVSYTHLTLPTNREV